MEQINHPVFGALEKTVADGEVHYDGSLLNTEATRPPSSTEDAPYVVHIAGSVDVEDAETLAKAAAAHAIFLEKVVEIRRQTIALHLADDPESWFEVVQEVFDDIGEEVTVDQEYYTSLFQVMHVNYWVPDEETGVIFEEPEGFVGMDIGASSDLQFSEIQPG